MLHSEAGHFVLRLTGIERPEPLNRMHRIEMTLTAVNGEPVTGATVLLTGRHRYALNPLPTSPLVRPGPTAGSYGIKGLRFHIPGDWRLVFEIELAEVRDRATFELTVE